MSELITQCNHTPDNGLCLDCEHINAFHNLGIKNKELEKENEELKAELKEIVTHYQCSTLAVRDRLALSNCSDIELSDAYDRLEMSETWLKENYSHMKLDWF